MTDTITNPAVAAVTVHQDRLWESLMTLLLVSRKGVSETAAWGHCSKCLGRRGPLLPLGGTITRE
jgi:hypothetical protein